MPPPHFDLPRSSQLPVRAPRTPPVAVDSLPRMTLVRCAPRTWQAVPALFLSLREAHFATPIFLLRQCLTCHHLYLRDPREYLATPPL